MFNTPLLFIIFNRPEITQKVFEEIKKQKPKYLFVAADGPRENINDDFEKCTSARKIVLDGIDWDCEVKTLFRKENLGCGKGVSLAINWFFENVEQGIILEDDCLPNHSFFSFCEVLLEKYKYNEQIYAISGDNFQNGISRGNASYFFSNYVFVWGWATWRRAWEKYDFNMEELDQFKKNNSICKIDKRKKFRDYWLNIFEEVAKKNIDTWDYQWVFSIWKNNALTILPNTNLISNIGFGENATHTKGSSPFANLETVEIGVISHPDKIIVNKKADDYASDLVYNIKGSKNNILSRLINSFGRV
ncbi:hypothetical protein [Gillisia limnaea]|uniref:Nucleotide-diphospho-sugar transferase domain-containing protein n=1 Tax=Gillisia limnaea (strain DSM 15749 / LMG 21470 / R-8282) TaxID=865937 RepID=H2BV92_GILLR|nr:hypothetical protein [Gillisia limnaea]EHQ01757.1 nucleotide-diphospho-sugar transferase domain-containing protein [Gillisia limnaea DSM 15749]